MGYRIYARKLPLFSFTFFLFSGLGSNPLTAKFAIQEPIDLPAATIFSPEQHANIDIAPHETLYKKINNHPSAESAATTFDPSFVIPEPVDFPAATIFSPEQHANVDIASHKMLCERVAEKQKKFKNTHLLIVPNTTSNIKYIIFGGISPQKELKLDEIDSLKIFGLSRGDTRNQFAALAENPARMKGRALKIFETSYRSFLQKIDEYIAFFEEKFDGIFLQNIKKLRAQFQVARDRLQRWLKRLHGPDIADHFKKVIDLALGLPDNPPFNHLQELFRPELLLFYAVENNIAINGFNFGTFRQQNPLHFCLDKDMALFSEILWAWFSTTTERADKRLIVSSFKPNECPTRLPDSQFPRYTRVPNFIKIAFRKTIP
ncbi:MAG: hypothetical protein LBG09_03810 [Puniceicoccales bacterium]|jgi:hypothetical protein|nr:hypothetical protein [Puniceicoccales bacterium]